MGSSFSQKNKCLTLISCVNIGPNVWENTIKMLRSNICSKQDFLHGHFYCFHEYHKVKWFKIKHRLQTTLVNIDLERFTIIHIKNIFNDKMKITMHYIKSYMYMHEEVEVCPLLKGTFKR